MLVVRYGALIDSLHTTNDGSTARVGSGALGTSPLAQLPALIDWVMSFHGDSVVVTLLYRV